MPRAFADRKHAPPQHRGPGGALALHDLHDRAEAAEGADGPHHTLHVLAIAPRAGDAVLAERAQRTLVPQALRDVQAAICQGGDQICQGFPELPSVCVHVLARSQHPYQHLSSRVVEEVGAESGLASDQDVQRHATRPLRVLRRALVAHGLDEQGQHSRRLWPRLRGRPLGGGLRAAVLAALHELVDRPDHGAPNRHMSW
mmetsp:Transcript_2849/g.8490  ORF Transcript_2849/g.8490 Transcript_2849/m.8490 type:complete len:200 (-) Transcript_2849:494-1093(-)